MFLPSVFESPSALFECNEYVPGADFGIIKNKLKSVRKIISNYFYILVTLFFDWWPRNLNSTQTAQKQKYIGFKILSNKKNEAYREGI